MLTLRTWTPRKVQSVLPSLALIGCAVATGAFVGRSPALAIAGSIALVVTAVGLTRSRGRSWLSLIVAIGWGLSVFVAEAGFGGVDGLAALSPVKLAPLVFLAAGALWIALRCPAVRPLPAVALWIVLYLTWLTLSAVLSEVPALSLLRVAQAALPAVVALILFTRGSDQFSLLLASGAACAAHVLWSVLHPVYVGNIGSQRLTGLLIANSFAFACALVIVVCVGLWQGHLIPHHLMLPATAITAMAVYGVTKSIGRTASIGIPLAICASVLASRSKNRQQDDGSISRRRRFLVVALCGSAAFLSLFVERSAAMVRDRQH